MSSQISKMDLEQLLPKSISTANLAKCHLSLCVCVSSARKRERERKNLASEERKRKIVGPSAHALRPQVNSTRAVLSLSLCIEVRKAPSPHSVQVTCFVKCPASVHICSCKLFPLSLSPSQ